MDKRLATSDPPLGDGDLALVRRLLRDYLGRQKLTLFFAILCMAGGAATTAMLAWLLDPAIKLIFLEKRTDMVLLIPAAIVAVVFVRAALNFGETLLSNSVGQRIVGPAIIEEPFTTIVLHPRQRAALDRFGNYHITVGSPA